MSVIPETKRCFGPCQRDLAISSEFFGKHDHGKYGLQSRCRDCVREANRLFVLAYPEKKKAQDKKYAASHRDNIRVNSHRYDHSEKGKRRKMSNWLHHKYGLTEEQYQELWNKQSGLCAICGSPERKEEAGGRLHVDHNHETKVIRGLLCGKCNRGIGMFDDNGSLLIKAIGYLEQPEKHANIPVKTEFKPRRRDDVSDTTLKELRDCGLSFEKIGEIVNLSRSGVQQRLVLKWVCFLKTIGGCLRVVMHGARIGVSESSQSSNRAFGALPGYWDTENTRLVSKP